MRKGIHGVYTVKMRISRHMPRWLSTVDFTLILFLFCFTFSLSQCCVFFFVYLWWFLNFFLFFSISSVSCCSFLGDCQSSTCLFLVIFFRFFFCYLKYTNFVNFLVIFEILNLKTCQNSEYLWLVAAWQRYEIFYFLKFSRFWFHFI